MKKKIKDFMISVFRKVPCLGRAAVIFKYVKLLLPKNVIEREKMIVTINRFVKKENLSNKAYVRGIKLDMLYSKLVYRVTYDEYFLFEFSNLSKVGRQTFIGDYERIDLCNTFGNSESKMIFDNKYQTYQKFKQYYKRDIIQISDKSDYATFEEYVKNHDDFMVKPISKSFGKGIYRVCTRNTEFSMQELFTRILGEGECILEERIKQSAELAMFHQESVNTVRFTTFIQNNEIKNLYSFFRMGCGNNVVDNAGAGGIFATVDVNTGIIITVGIAEDGKSYIKHPDTGTKIIGYQIPKWNELLEMVNDLARIVPEQQYVGWDLALTDIGWVVVEGNRRGQFIHQYANKAGCREIIEKALS